MFRRHARIVISFKLQLSIGPQWHYKSVTRINSPHYLSAAAPTTARRLPPSHLSQPLLSRSATSTVTTSKRRGFIHSNEDLSTQTQLLKPLHAHLCRRGLQSLCSDRRSFAFLHAGWAQTGTSCRTVQTCWDAWRGDLSSPFFPNPNSLRLLSLPAHACRSYPHSRVKMIAGGALTGTEN